MNTGPEWLLQVLAELLEEERLYTLMTIWRCWHVRNEIVHHKRTPPVEASARFLSSYICSLLSLQANPNGDHVKGKMVTVPHYKRRALSHAGEEVKKRQGLDAPPAGGVKY